MSDRLVLPDLLTERLSLLRITHGVVDSCLRDTDRSRRDLDATELQPAHHLREALTFLAAEQRLRRREVTVEGQLARLDSLVAELGQVPRNGESVARLDEKQRHPGMCRRCSGVGLAEQR